MPFRIFVPPDPKAGEWRHEIITRTLYSIAAWVMYSIFYNIYYAYIYNFWGGNPTWIGVVLHTGIGVLVEVSSETLVRRSWRLGSVLYSIVVLAWVFQNFILPNEFAGAKISLAMIPFVGALIGLAAGLYTGHLLAGVFGMLAGSLGGYACIHFDKLVWTGISVNNFSKLQFFLVFSAFYSFYAVIRTLPIGIAVWAGVKFSKREPTLQ